MAAAIAGAMNKFRCGSSWWGNSLYSASGVKMSNANMKVAGPGSIKDPLIYSKVSSSETFVKICGDLPRRTT